LRSFSSKTPHFVQECVFPARMNLILRNSTCKVPMNSTNSSNLNDCSLDGLLCLLVIGCTSSSTIMTWYCVCCLPNCVSCTKNYLYHLQTWLHLLVNRTSTICPGLIGEDGSEKFFSLQIVQGVQMVPAHTCNDNDTSFNYGIFPALNVLFEFCYLS
jgi:hypothetical protein